MFRRCSLWKLHCHADAAPDRDLAFLATSKNRNGRIRPRPKHENSIGHCEAGRRRNRPGKVPSRNRADHQRARAQSRTLFFTRHGAVVWPGGASEKHLDNIIVDGTGEMRQLKDTVYLEGSMCGCAHVAFGGCPRGEFAYWREIWLRRPAN